jgi:hypothetical protein
MTITVHCQDVLPLAYKFSKRLAQHPSLHQLIHKLSIATSIAHFRFTAENTKTENQLWLAQRDLPNWQRSGRGWKHSGGKRLTVSAKEDEGCCTSVPAKGHCIMYTADGRRFEVPLVCLNTTVFGELLRMSQEEFGFASDGRITLPCDATVLEYMS